MTTKAFSTKVIPGTKTFNVINNQLGTVINSEPLSQYKATQLVASATANYKADGTAKKISGRKPTVHNLTALEAEKAEVDGQLELAKAAKDADMVAELQAITKTLRRDIRKARKQSAQ